MPTIYHHPNPVYAARMDLWNRVYCMYNNEGGCSPSEAAEIADGALYHFDKRFPAQSPDLEDLD